MVTGKTMMYDQNTNFNYIQRKFMYNLESDNILPIDLTNVMVSQQAITGSRAVLDQ